MAARYGYLGKAVAYPITISRGAGVIQEGLSVVESSIIMILMTPTGTRPFLPDYGSRLHELMFEPNDAILARLLTQYILDPLNTYEKRAKFFDVDVITALDAALCTIHYKVLSSNEIKQFTYPFFRGKWAF